MHKDNFFQKASNLLNTSSETFMLIALVSLFVLPVVMAKNLEPVVKNAYQGPTITSVSQPVTEAETNVLGISAENAVVKTLKELLVEETPNLAFFNKHSSTLTEKNYTLTVETTKRFGKVNVFTIKNDTSSTLAYNLSANVNGDIKVLSNQQKQLYINETAYNLDETVPAQLLVSPGQEIVVALASNKTSPSNITINLTETGQ
jgi:hypothetical protein